MAYCLRLVYAFLVLSVLLPDLRLRAEPLYPLLGPGTLDSLRATLRQARPDANRVNVLLRLAEDLLNKRDGAPARVDSAERYLKEALALTHALGHTPGKIRGGYLSGLVAAHRGDGAGAVSLITGARRLGRQTGNLSLEAEGWYYLGEVYDRSERGLPEKIRCYEQSKRLYRQAGDTEKEAYLLKNIADMHHLQGQSARAVSELLEVIALYRSVGYPKLHYTYDLLVAVNRRIGNYQEAIGHGLACVESALATRDTAFIGLFYGRLGVLHEEIDQWQEAMGFHYKALAHFRQENNVLMVLHTARNISNNLLGQGKAREALSFYQHILGNYPPDDQESTLEVASALSECYLALKQYALAERHYRRMLRIEKELNESETRKIHTYERIGNFYLVTRQYGNARRCLDQALHLNAREGTLRGAVNIHLLLFKLDSAQGRYKEAIVHHQRYKALSDSIFNETRSKQVASLQVQHKSKEKEQNIALLTHENQVQRVSIRQREFQRNSLIVGALLLLLLLIVVYNRYRLKIRSNRLLQQQKQEIRDKNEELQGLLTEKENLLTHKRTLLEEKEWLLSEVHHRVKNNLQVVMSLLNSQAAFLQDDNALSAIRESQQQVYAISLIHQNLYKSDNIARIEMPAYVREVVEYLIDSFRAGDHVRYQASIEPVGIDLAVAVPLGLIINEAVTNALKHAFPGGRPGLIAVTLAEAGEQHFLLTVTDNGVGLGQDFDFAGCRTLGMILMKGLSKQLRGTFKLESADGLTIRVLFANSTPTQAYATQAQFS
ncbi:MAG: histidine kinase [Cytophagales bacterium]|nr:histidine kinase [Cytophagales bacterium]